MNWIRKWAAVLLLMTLALLGCQAPGAARPKSTAMALKPPPLLGLWLEDADCALHAAALTRAATAADVKRFVIEVPTSRVDDLLAVMSANRWMLSKIIVGLKCFELCPQPNAAGAYMDRWGDAATYAPIKPAIDKLYAAGVRALVFDLEPVFANKECVWNIGQNHPFGDFEALCAGLRSIVPGDVKIMLYPRGMGYMLAPDTRVAGRKERVQLDVYADLGSAADAAGFEMVEIALGRDHRAVAAGMPADQTDRDHRLAFGVSRWSLAYGTSTAYGWPELKTPYQIAVTRGTYCLIYYPGLNEYLADPAAVLTKIRNGRMP